MGREYHNWANGTTDFQKYVSIRKKVGLIEQNEHMDTQNVIDNLVRVTGSKKVSQQQVY